MPNEQMPFLKRVLLVVDGSQASEAATAFALRMAAAVGNELVAAYVVDTATMDYLQQMHIFVSEERDDLEASINAKGQAYLDRTKRLAQAVNAHVDTVVLRGRTHQAVLNYVREYNVDAIVIGGRRGLYHDKDIFTVERELLLELATVPVMVIK